MVDLASHRGPGAFGRAYAFMLGHDAHAPGSVDRALTRDMVRLRMSNRGWPGGLRWLYGEEKR